MPTRSNNSGNHYVREQMAKFRRLLHTSRGKDILLFLFFLCVSYVFWLILELNDTAQRDFDLELRVTGVPEGVKFISEVPENVHVSVRDKGIQLAHYAWGGTPKLNINYSDLTVDELNDRVVLSEQMLNTRLREIFNGSAQIVSSRPDSLSIIVTNRPPRMAKVIPDVDVTTMAQCVISGRITVNPDSVAVYSATHAPIPPAKISTEKLIRGDLKDTLRISLALNHSGNLKVEPAKVTVTIPVEPLISKTREIPVKVLNVPKNHNVVLFPSRAKISYLLPMSLFNSERGSVTVTGDYTRRANGKIPLSISEIPDNYHAVELLTDSIEYLIEQRIDESVSAAQESEPSIER